MGRHVFSCRSLLLSTTILNDKEGTKVQCTMPRKDLVGLKLHSKALT